jgi:hypothetical protein
MTRFTRITITAVSCLALSILGIGGVASAHSSQVAVGAAIMAPQGHDWCC